jgi:hypothetical protein
MYQDDAYDMWCPEHIERCIRSGCVETRLSLPLLVQPSRNSTFITTNGLDRIPSVLTGSPLEILPIVFAAN